MPGNRVGCFLGFIGLTLIGLFVYSDIARQADVSYLVLGVPVLLLGMLLFWRKPNAAQTPSERFRLFQKKKKP